MKKSCTQDSDSDSDNDFAKSDVSNRTNVSTSMQSPRTVSSKALKNKPVTVVNECSEDCEEDDSLHVPIKYSFVNALPEFELLKDRTLLKACNATEVNHIYFQVVSKFFKVLNERLPKPSTARITKAIKYEETTLSSLTFGKGSFVLDIKSVLHKLIPSAIGIYKKYNYYIENSFLVHS